MIGMVYAASVLALTWRQRVIAGAALVVVVAAGAEYVRQRLSQQIEPDGADWLPIHESADRERIMMNTGSDSGDRPISAAPFDTVDVRPGHPTPRGRHASGKSDPGLTRENNEDTLLCDPKRGLFVVLDGMGGMAEGEVASRIGRESLDAFFTPERIAGLQNADDETLTAALRDALTEANTHILEYVKANPFSRGMGAAVVLALLVGDRLALANMGDCRAYTVTDSAITLRSKDQTMAAFLIETGELTPEEGRHHRSRNTLLTALGEKGRLTINQSVHTLAPDERVLLCSDGLWDMLTDSEMAQLVRDYPTPEDTVQQLIDLANQPPSGEPGGQDNITAIVITGASHA